MELDGGLWAVLGAWLSDSLHPVVLCLVASDYIFL